MKDIEIQEKIIKIVERILYIDSVKTNSLLMKDLGADSLDIVELIMDIEETFEVEIPDSEAKDFGDDITIEDLVKLVQTKLKGLK